jgi:hypothetical protein
VADPKSSDGTTDIGALLTELALKIDRVKTLYEQFFMGIEKVPPETARKEVTRAMLQLQQQQIRNTGLRFRFNTMLQKWNIYMSYWNRTLREIEAGTYLPHLQKARRAAEREGKELPAELARAKRLGSSSDIQKIAQPSPPPLFPAPPAATAARPRAQTQPEVAPIPGMSEADLRALHKKYVDARVQTGEPAQVSYQALVSSLQKQVPRLLEQTGVREVRFDVAVQNGKAVLKAFPKK